AISRKSTSFSSVFNSYSSLSPLSLDNSSVSSRGLSGIIRGKKIKQLEAVELQKPCPSLPGKFHCLSQKVTGLLRSGRVIPQTNFTYPPAGAAYGPTEIHTAYQLPCTPGGAVAPTP